MKWAHPLKSRKISDAMADVLCEKTGKVFEAHLFWRNAPISICYEGQCSWGTYQNMSGPDNYHSWDSMRDCLKYGFDIDKACCLTAKDKDEFHKNTESE